MTKECIQDFTQRVAAANKTEMVVVLYDIGIVYIKDAIACIEGADFKGARIEIGRIRDTLKELMDSLDTSTEIGHNLLKLYIFCSGELTKAFLDYDKGCLYHVESILSKLRDAYREVAKRDTSGPVMEHTETVYNGFTYGRNSQVNNVSNKELNRGILI